MKGWQQRQKRWKASIAAAGLTQKQFCSDNNINEISFSNWVSGRTRCNTENEELMDELISLLEDR